MAWLNSTAMRTRNASSSSGIPSGILTPSASCSRSRSSTIRRACSGEKIKVNLCLPLPSNESGHVGEIATAVIQASS
jgi:hypothetical protein